MPTDDDTPEFLLDPISVAIAPLDMSSPEVAAWHTANAQHQATLHRQPSQRANDTDRELCESFEQKISIAPPREPRLEQRGPHAHERSSYRALRKARGLVGRDESRTMLIARENELHVMLRLILTAHALELGLDVSDHEVLMALPTDVVDVMHRAETAMDKYRTLLPKTACAQLRTLWDGPTIDPTHY